MNQPVICVGNESSEASLRGVTRPAPCRCCHSLNWLLHKLISFIKHILHLNLEKHTQERRTGLFLFHRRGNYRQPSHHKVSAINETSFQISQINIQTSSTYCSCSLSSNLTVTNEKAWKRLWLPNVCSMWRKRHDPRSLWVVALTKLYDLKYKWIDKLVTFNVFWLRCDLIWSGRAIYLTWAWFNKQLCCAHFYKSIYDLKGNSTACTHQRLFTGFGQYYWLWSTDYDLLVELHWKNIEKRYKKSYIWHSILIVM